MTDKQINGILGAASGAVSLANTALGASRTADANQILNANSAYGTFGTNHQYNNFDSLQSAFDEYSMKTHYNSSDFRDNSQDAGNILTGAMTGAGTGLAVGSIVPGVGNALAAGIGAVVGAGSGIVGNIIGHHNANKKAEWATNKALAIDEQNKRDYRNQINAIDTLNNNEVLGHISAFGGNLNYNSANFPLGYTEINTGGTHEQNPLGGVQQGVDPQGIPNLVEEGEVILNGDNIKGYVLTNRYGPSKHIKDKYKINGNHEKDSFAEVFKNSSIVKESDERPNDVLSKNALNSFMEELAEDQEIIRQKKEARKLQRELQNMTPEEQAYLMQAAQAEQGQMPQEGLGIPQVAANGGQLGNIFASGSQMNPDIDPKTLVTRKDRNPLLVYDENGVVDFISSYLVNSDFEKYRSMYADWWDKPEFAEVQAEYLNQLKNHNSDTDISNFTLDDFLEYTSDGVDDEGNNNPKADGYAHELAGEKAKAFFESLNQPRRVTTNMVNTPFGVMPATADDYFSSMLTDSPGVIGMSTYREGDELGGTPIINGNLGGGHTKPLITPEDGNEDGEPRARLKRERDRDRNKGTKKFPIYDSWLRYLPALGFAYNIADSYIKPDYSSVDSLNSLASTAGNYESVAWKPLGDYLTYRPLDRQYALNLLNANNAATRRSLLNTSGGNRGTAMAGLLAADYNAGNNIGNLFRQAEESNQAQRQKVAEFNRATNQANSEGFLKADMANQSAAAQALGRSVDLKSKAIALREELNQGKKESRSANISGLMNFFGDIGREKIDRKTQANMLKNGVWPHIGKNGGKLKRRRGLTI